MNKLNLVIYILLLLSNSFLSFGQCTGDVTPPVAVCQSNYTAYLDVTGVVYVSAADINNASSDNCGISTMLINGHPTDTFDCSDLFLGSNTATLTVIDSAGNIDSCTTTIVLQDIIAPFVVCNLINNDFYLNINGTVNVLASDVGIGIDECGIIAEMINGAWNFSFGLNDVGVQAVTYEATDLSGNSSQCMSTINIIDTFNRYYIGGNIFHDVSLNCTKDNGELDLNNIIVQAISGSQTYYGTSDVNGDYSIVVGDTGAYTISPIFPSPYWQACPAAYPIAVNSTSNYNNLDFAFQGTSTCPFMEVQISAPLLRTNNSSFYTVSYCNNGAVDAVNATVDVDLDAFLNIIGASIPIVSQSGNSLTFNLGNVPLNTCGAFTIECVVDTSAILGQTHCTQAHIYPDSLCISSLWAGAQLDVQAKCLVDSIKFTLYNIGANAYGPDNYSIFEDHVILNIGSTGVIPSNDSAVIVVATNQGKTYRIEVPQQAGFPLLIGNSILSAGLEHCDPLPNGNFNTGILTQFSTNNSSPFIAIDCQPNIGSYDPNDKSAQPEGYDSNFHYIYDHTQLNYKIRFQNTGTDTAFNITVIDTLSSLLDPGSITMGASSHAYTWQLRGSNILEVTFANVLLPDSNVNVALSQGFFHFEIDQKANNPLGSVIYNSADIYFDLNAPIKTNTTWHTIDDNFVEILLSSEQLFEDQVDVLVYPNPFSHSTTIEVQGKAYEQLNFSLYDLAGRAVGQARNSYSNKIQFSRGQLLPGVYIYKLMGDDQLINTGKVVVQ